MQRALGTGRTNPPRTTGPAIGCHCAIAYARVHAFHGGTNPAPNKVAIHAGNLGHGRRVVGVAYDEELYLENCAVPVTFTLTSGSLPTGTTLSSIGDGGAKISGTPSAVGTFRFTLQASNAKGSATQSFSIVVNAASGGGGSYTFFA